MDTMTLLRILFTVLAALSFLLIVVWAYGQAARKRFSDAAMLPINDNDSPIVPTEAMTAVISDNLNAEQLTRK